MAEIEERVDRLEEAVQEFVLNVGIEFNKLYNSQMRTEAELRAFKDEMKEFRDEMKEFKDEMKEFKDEMKEFKDDMKEFKDESRQANREMNRRWGELANKMGTLVEDQDGHLGRGFGGAEPAADRAGGVGPRGD